VTQASRRAQSISDSPVISKFVKGKIVGAVSGSAKSIRRWNRQAYILSHAISSRSSILTTRGDGCVHAGTLNGVALYRMFQPRHSRAPLDAEVHQLLQRSQFRLQDSPPPTSKLINVCRILDVKSGQYILNQGILTEDEHINKGACDPSCGSCQF